MADPIANPKVMKASQVLGRFSECYRRLEEAGLTFNDLQYPIDDPEFRDRLVEFWRSYGGKQKIAEAGNKLDTNRSKSLPALISSGKFGYVNPNITEANFPDVGIGHDFKVYDFKKTVSSDYAIKQMEKDGYRPANLRELLIWISANWNGLDLVVALGQIWRDSYGDRCVPYVFRWIGERELYLDYFSSGWYGRFRFLAVRKS